MKGKYYIKYQILKKMFFQAIWVRNKKDIRLDL